MSRIVLSGGTGFIGRELTKQLCARGEQVVVLSRKATTTDLPTGATIQVWTPEQPGAWMKVVDGAEAVIHLAGESVMGARWTPAVKQRILDSRVVSTRLLVQAMHESTSKPKAFLCASAIGYYGSCPPEQSLTEEGPPGSDFLASVVREWEATAQQASNDGIRVVRLRIGIVLGDGGGALERMLLPFRLFVGGPIGSGNQVVSWIHREDTVGLIMFALDHPEVAGAMNVTAPNPVSMRELAAVLGRVLRRPSWLPAPSFALKIALGESAEAILSGQRVIPEVALRTGYEFKFPELERALRQAVQA